MIGRRGLGAPLLRAVNLAFALALNAAHAPRQRPRVGVLDLDIFGPSIPKLMALEDAEELDDPDAPLEAVVDDAGTVAVELAVSVTVPVPVVVLDTVAVAVSVVVAVSVRRDCPLLAQRRWG